MRERKRMKHETHAKKTKFTARLKGQSPSCHLKENGGVYSGKVYFLGGCKGFLAGCGWLLNVFGWLWVVAKCFWLVLGRCGWFWLVVGGFG